MEFLKKILLATCLVFSSQSFAQDSKELQMAFSKSYAYEAKYQYDAAIKVIKDLYSERSYPINLRLGWLNYINKNYGNSITYYQKASAIMPSSAESLWAILSPQIALEKWVDAEKTYLSILKLEPRSATALYKLGLIYYYRKNYTLAKKYFDVALNLYPFDYHSLLMSGWTNYFLGNFNEAKILFNRVLLIYISDASAIQGLSLIK
jgi:tetratricopeptide (TPR) repeat protein